MAFGQIAGLLIIRFSNSKFITKILFLLAILFFIFNSSSVFVNAQVDSLGVAVPIEIEGDIEPGSIVCSKEGGHFLCNEQYAASIVGVVVDKPPIAFVGQELPLALNSGNAIVRVSTVNGVIKKGDLITTSEKPGIGQKANVNGFVLGMSLEDFNSEDPEDIGQILVSINIHPTSSFVGSRSNLVASIRQALSAPVVAPLDSLRYFLSFIISLISFALGFIYFGRVVRSGVEAIGRNPLASRAIQATVVVNIVVTVVIVLTGLAISLLILII